LRDLGALEAALDRARNRFPYEVSDIVTLGAAYAVALVRAHAFSDGNKRTAFVVAALFLERNGFRFNGPEAEVVMQMIALAAKRVSEASFTTWFRTHSASNRSRGRRG
jgi:death-on-curing protein